MTKYPIHLFSLQYKKYKQKIETKQPTANLAYPDDTGLGKSNVNYLLGSMNNSCTIPIGSLQFCVEKLTNRMIEYYHVLKIVVLFIAWFLIYYIEKTKELGRLKILNIDEEIFKLANLSVKLSLSACNNLRLSLMPDFFHGTV